MEYDQNSVALLVKALENADSYINGQLRKAKGKIDLVGQCSWLAPAAAELKEYAESRSQDNYQAYMQRAALALATHTEARSAEHWRDIALGQAIIDLALKRVSVVLLESISNLKAWRGEVAALSEEKRNISRYDIHTTLAPVSELKERIEKLTDCFNDIHEWANELDFSLFDEFSDRYQLYVNLNVDPEEILRFPEGAYGDV